MESLRIMAILLASGCSVGILLGAQMNNELPPSQQITLQAGSPSAVAERQLRIGTNEILPVSVLISNTITTRKLSLRISESDRDNIPPVPGGFKVISQNPTPLRMYQPGEKQIILVSVRIQKPQYQLLLLELVDDTKKVVKYIYLSINNPAFAGKPFLPFSEEKLKHPGMPKKVIMVD